MQDAGQAPFAVRRIPMLALRGLVLFPGIILHFDVGRHKSIAALNKAMDKGQKIFLVAQRDFTDDDPSPNDLYKIGVVAEIKQILKIGQDTVRVIVEGLYRARIVTLVKEDPFFLADVMEYPVQQIPEKQGHKLQAMIRSVKELFQVYCSLTPKVHKDIFMSVMASQDPHYICEYICGNIMLRFEDKQEILEESYAAKRLMLLLSMLKEETEILDLEQDIMDKVKDQLDKNQRDYYLREQIKIISDELGEGDGFREDSLEFRDEILALNLPEEVEDKLLKEADRLYRMGSSSSHEATVLRNYLETCIELPWNKMSKDKLDVKRAAAVLDYDHYGLEKVKERILELIAAMAMAPELKGQIICLVGPPGVGKTSVGKSIARALGKKYVRISLGGVRDEADIRGHRKTYIGSMPGRIINAMKLAGTKNPVMLLDEVDKLANDFRGDPTSALLEVLDSEQNNAFRDHYLEVPFDLSNVLFITTANDASMIPAPLYDRMEVIELSSYTRVEKYHIAREHLIKKQLKRHGLKASTMRIDDSALWALIDSYTREAGVRNLEREIASLCRKAAKQLVSGDRKKVVVTARNIKSYLGTAKYKDDQLSQIDQIGVSNGLAWTSVGGEMLQIEVNILEGSGKLELTGSLGDVMKESARAAITYVRSRARDFGIDPDFHKTKDIHIHVPEGAVPKDGPSAGITMATALISALTDIKVRHDVAMTGEITLRGRVLPIGGLKEKTIAAYKHDMKTVVVPLQNEPDIDDCDPLVKDALSFVYCENMDEVIGVALATVPQPRPQEAVDEIVEGDHPAIPVDRGSQSRPYMAQ